MLRKIRMLVLAVLLVGAVALGAHAANNESGYPTSGIVASGYSADSQTAAFRTGINGADSTALGTVIGVTANRFYSRGRPNISVSGRFSNAAQTAKVRLLSTFQNGASYVVLGISQEITLTATSFTDQTTGNFLAPTAVFDSAGATHCWVIVTAAPAAGTLDLWLGSF